MGANRNTSETAWTTVAVLAICLIPTALLIIGTGR